MSETGKLVRVDHQPIVRVLPCAGCGYPFDHELLGKYGCPNCEGEITEKATKQKIQKISAYCHKGQSAGKPAKQDKSATNGKAICYNGAAMKKTTLATLRKAAAAFGLEIQEDKTEPRFEMFAPDGQCWEGGELHSMVYVYGSCGSYLPAWRNDAMEAVMRDIAEYGPRLEIEPEDAEV